MKKKNFTYPDGGPNEVKGELYGHLRLHLDIFSAIQNLEESEIEKIHNNTELAKIIQEIKEKNPIDSKEFFFKKNDYVKNLKQARNKIKLLKIKPLTIIPKIETNIKKICDKIEKIQTQLIDKDKQDIEKLFKEIERDYKKIDPIDKIKLKTIAIKTGHKRASDIDSVVDSLRMDINWIQKDDLLGYKTTEYGRLITKIVDNFMSFMSSNYDFFAEHSFGDLPSSLLYRLGILNGCRKLEKTNVLDMEKEIMKRSKEKLVNILNEFQYAREMKEDLLKKFENNEKFSLSTVIPKNPKDRKNISPKPFEDIKEFREQIDNIIKKNVKKGKNYEQKREVFEKDKVTVGMVMNDSEGIIMFPATSDNEPDTRTGFYGTDSEFLEWCTDYFEFCKKG